MGSEEERTTIQTNGAVSQDGGQEPPPDVDFRFSMETFLRDHPFPSCAAVNRSSPRAQLPALPVGHKAKEHYNQLGWAVDHAGLMRLGALYRAQSRLDESATTG